MTDGIVPIVMPKWGLSMKEGTVIEVLISPGTRVAVGDHLMDVETDKIDGTVEAADAGLLRRITVEPGRTYPVRALLGVLAEESVTDAELDVYIAGYVVPESELDGSDDESPYASIAVDGITVRYARQGDGERTVLLVHGFGGDLDNWLFNLGPLAARTEVVAFDLPGHGGSDLALPGTTVADLARFTASFCDALGLASVDVIGHSLGGAIGAQLALDRAEQVRSLAVIASAGLGTEIDGDYLSAFIAATSRRDLKAALVRLFADEAHVTRSLLDGVLRYKRLDGVGELLGRLRDGVFPNGRQAALPTAGIDPSRTPLLVVWGKEDRVIPVDHAERAAAGSRRVTLDAAGHMVQMERPGEVNAALLEHLGVSGT